MFLDLPEPDSYRKLFAEIDLFQIQILPSENFKNIGKIRKTLISTVL